MDCRWIVPQKNKPKRGEGGKMQTNGHVKRDYKRIKIVGLITAILVLALVGLYRHNVGQVNPGQPEASGIVEPSNIKRVMLLGVDERKDDAGRSDTLMVLTWDENTDKAVLLSVPRDTRVKIDGIGYDKINHAYAYGGRKLSQNAVENLLGVEIDYYVLVNTAAFERIVDAVGGVDIDVEKRMYYEDPWDDNGGLIIDLYPGEQHLDGERAIQYVRYRDGEGDIGRIRRQQKFIKAMLAQVISPYILPELPNLVAELRSVIDTNMTMSELVSMATQVKQIHDLGLGAQTVPGKPAYLKDISYWLPDIEHLREMLVTDMGQGITPEVTKAAKAAAAVYAKDLPEGIQLAAENIAPPETKIVAKDKKDSEIEAEKEADLKPMKPEEISVMVINSSGINGAGAEVAQILQGKGFVITGVETGRTDSKEYTTITTSTRNTDVFYGMPFECIIRDGGSKNQAVVDIGRDYKKQGI